MTLAECCCDERQRVVELENELCKGEAVALTLEPYINRMEVSLPLSSKLRGAVMGYSLTPGSESSSIHPFYCATFEVVPSMTSFLILEGRHSHLVLLCLSHRDQTCLLRGTSGGLLLSAESGSSREANQLRHALIACSHKSVHVAIRRCLSYGIELTGGMGHLLTQKPPLPHWLHHLGWESQGETSHSQVLAAIDSLQNAGIYPSYVILNEGWQELVVNRLSQDDTPSLFSFQAEPTLFPQGLKAIVSDLQSRGIQHVGVWHGVMGSRGGIHPQLAQHYELPPGPQGQYFLGYDLGRTFQFYHDYYSFLREQGVSFLRVGDQNCIYHFCRGGMSATDICKNLQTALQAAASVNFNSAHLNSDCLRNENIFYWTSSRIARCDDEPEKPSAQRIRDNLSQSLWLQHLMYPDMGTWSSQSREAERYAILHALADTVCSLCDEPGTHGKCLISRVALPSGKLLRADSPLTICDDCLFVNPLEQKRVYKAHCRSGHSGVLALFHLHPSCSEMTVELSSDDIPGLEGEAFAVYSYQKGWLGLVKPSEVFQCALAPESADVLTFSPVRSQVAVIGCPQFFLLSGVLTSLQYTGESIHVGSIVRGPLLLACGRQVLEARCQDKVIPFDYDHKRHTLVLDPYQAVTEENCFYTVRFEA